MRRISEFPPAELPKPSPPKKKVGSAHSDRDSWTLTMFHHQYEFKPVFSIPPSSVRQRNETVEVATVEDVCDQHNPDRISQTLHRFHNLDIHSPTPSPVFVHKPSFTSKPLVEASLDDIFGSDDDLDWDVEFEADFADDELEDDEDEDEDYDTLDSNSVARYISAFLGPVTDSDDEDFE